MKPAVLVGLDLQTARPEGTVALAADIEDRAGDWLAGLIDEPAGNRAAWLKLDFQRLALFTTQLQIPAEVLFLVAKEEFTGPLRMQAAHGEVGGLQDAVEAHVPVHADGGHTREGLTVGTDDGALARHRRR
jgi:hypothetical protein